MPQPGDYPEGQDLADAWNYMLDVLVNKVPAHINSLTNLATKPIEG